MPLLTVCTTTKHSEDPQVAQTESSDSEMQQSSVTPAFSDHQDVNNENGLEDVPLVTLHPTPELPEYTRGVLAQSSECEIQQHVGASAFCDHQDVNSEDGLEDVPAAALAFTRESGIQVNTLHPERHQPLSIARVKTEKDLTVITGLPCYQLFDNLCDLLDNAVSIPPSPVDRPPPRWVAARGASLGEELWARRAVDSSQHYIDRRSPPGECRWSGGGNHSAPQRPGEATGVGA
ncbi:hypothetical protein MTO96_012169 [Rhipicephalus appendiculatus]